MRNPPAKKYMPILFLVSLFAWLAFAEAGERGDWDIRIGAGARYVAKYEGSDEMKTRALPLLGITWKDRVFLNPRDGLGVRLYDEGGLAVSAGVGYVFARDESDGDALRGMGDIDETAAANLNLKYGFGLLAFRAGVSRHLGGSEGTLVKAGVGAIAPLALLNGRMKPQDSGSGGLKGPLLKLGASATWADGAYMESYFGVNPAQSSASGHPRYEPKAGFKSVDFEVGVIYLFADGHWAVNAQAGYSQLLGDAADSPIVRDEGRFSGGLFLSYRF
ncbi:MAG: MipA/OmpV family protein [Nitrospinae bacterium]|nr:MipA/OmpV family protein [Nitrospinota bacterium]